MECVCTVAHNVSDGKKKNIEQKIYVCNEEKEKLNPQLMHEPYQLPATL